MDITNLSLMNNELLTQLCNNQKSLQLHQKSIKLQQDLLQSQGKRGFRFRDNPDNYPTLLTKYNEKIKPNMSDTDKFALLYTLLDDEAETIYNRHLAETDKRKTYGMCGLL